MADPYAMGLLILTVEFALVACGLTLVLVRGNRRRVLARVRDKQALTAKIDATMVARREALTMIFDETYGLDAAESTALAQDFIDREHAFYHAIIAMHVDQPNHRLLDLQAELNKVVAPWLRLTPKQKVAAVPTATTDTQPTADADSRAPAAHTEDEVSLDNPSPATAIPDPVPPAEITNAGDADYIDLDQDLDAELVATAAHPDPAEVTSDDLDALMENLDEEYKAAAA